MKKYNLISSIFTAQIKKILHKLILSCYFSLLFFVVNAQDNSLDISLFLDINDISGSSNPRKFTSYNDEFVFTAFHWKYGYELWIGDENDSRLLKDINPGDKSVNIQEITVLKDKLYFGALDIDQGEDAGETLWESDGTTEGTRPVASLPNIVPGGQLLTLTPTDNLLFFEQRTEEFGGELYVSDGTAAGTKMVKDINPGDRDAYIRTAVALGDKLIFAASGNTGRQKAWVSDGTPEGTFALTPESNGLNIYGKANGKVFFDIEGKPWVSDGTLEGTFLLRDFYPNTSPNLREITFLNDKAYFVANEYYASTDLWVSDGTIEGTKKFFDLSPTGQSAIGQLTIFDNQLVFTGLGKVYLTDGEKEPELIYPYSPDLMVGVGNQLFLADYIRGSNYLLVYDKVNGVRQLAAYEGYREEMILTDSTFFFAEGNNSSNLWTSDGTIEGTKIIAMIAGAEPRLLKARSGVFGDKLVFEGQSSTVGREPWISDGTIEGTQLLTDVNNSTAGSPFEDLTVFGDKLFFNVSNFTFSSGGFTTGFYLTDGTQEGTHLLTRNNSEVGIAGGKAFFKKFDFLENINEIWTTDGTIEGTTFLFDDDLINDFHPAGDRLFMNSWDKLWITDGTPTGTELIAELKFGFFNAPNNALSVGNSLYFPADDRQNGEELWVSDGTATGTKMLIDLYPGSRDAEIAYLTKLGDYIYFTAETNNPYRQLWRTDGTSAGTEPVTNFTTTYGNRRIEALTPAFGDLFFNFGEQLWRYDPEMETTTLVTPNLEIEQMIATASNLFMVIRNFEKTLWVSKGTAETTVPLVSSNDIGFRDLLAVGDQLFFQKDEEDTGVELWKSDGTSQGTYLVEDLYPGEENASPRFFAHFQDKFLMVASGPEFGREIYQLTFNYLRDSCQKIIQTNHNRALSIKDTLIASEMIVSTDTIEENVDISYIAGNVITLSSGFHAKAGALFLASINGIPCRTTPSIEQFESMENFSVVNLQESQFTEVTDFEIFPNPISQQTTISFAVSQSANIRFDLFDLSGKKLKTILPPTSFGQGNYEISYVPDGLKAGLYLLVFNNNHEMNVKKIVISNR